MIVPVDFFGRMGFKRNTPISAAEIVEQRRLLSHEVGNIKNVVIHGKC